jgi:dihydroxyacetone kinase-like protein
MGFDTVTLADLGDWLREYARLVAAHRDELTALDAAIGDADHGSNMDRGMTAVAAGLAGETVAGLFKQAGMTLVSTVGGASGPLYGTLFLRFGVAAGEVESLDTPGFAAALRAGLEGVVARGKAEPGDKTMFDALQPAVLAFEAAVDGPFAAALKAAAAAADAGRDATTAMLAHKGRASYLGERSVGHQDPGATSAALLIRAAAETLG